jgi:hypothetical protein
LIVTGDIFLLQDDGQLVELNEAAYETEALLQSLLAQHPDLLAGKQISPDSPRKEWDSPKGPAPRMKKGPSCGVRANTHYALRTTHYALRPRPEVIPIGEVVHANNLYTEEKPKWRRMIFTG